MDINTGLIEFIEKSPTAFQAVDSVVKMLKQDKSCCYRVRNSSSVIAYKVPQGTEVKGFHIVAAHTDSPMFKVKENPAIKDANGYVKLNVEKYGGMIVNSWLDRPLSVAGRIVCDSCDGLRSINVDLKEPVCIIPSLAIHMSRGHEDKPLSIQTDLMPIGSDGLYKAVADRAGVSEDSILGADLYVYNAQKGCIIGDEEGYICAPRLDDIQCVYSAASSFVESSGDVYVNVLAVFDNEEVGSLSRQGADSDFLIRVLKSIARELGKDEEGFNSMLDNSFLISADNAHAIHPNHPEKADLTNRPHINGGVVIKYHGGQKYTTDAYSGAYIKKLCKDNNIPYQIYHNNSDIQGGSTLGNLVMSNVSVPAADIGAPQLAMHSSYETAGVRDTQYLVKLMKAFYSL